MNGVWQRWPFLSRSPKAAAVTLDRVLQWPLFLSVGAICPWELGHSIHLECAVRPQLKPWMWTSGTATQAGRCFLFLFCVQLQLPTYGSGTGDICTDEEKCFFFFGCALPGSYGEGRNWIPHCFCTQVFTADSISSGLTLKVAQQLSDSKSCCVSSSSCHPE